jgi:hypothetical protein
MDSGTGWRLSTPCVRIGWCGYSMGSSPEMTHAIWVGGEPGPPFAFDGAVWVPDQVNGTVTRIATGAATE